MSIRVRTNTNGMKRARKAADTLRTGAMSGLGTGPFADMRRQWGKRYEAFVRKRFTANSRGVGDGSWPVLAMSTIRARARKPGFIKRKKGVKVNGRFVYGSRVGFISLARDTRFQEGPDLGGFLHGRLGGAIVNGKGISVAILKDTGLLFNALTIGQYGNLLEAIPGGVRFGFANVGHPNKSGHGGGPTIAQIAKWHDGGVPSRHLPRRRILVQPDPVTRAGMTQDAARALARSFRIGGGA